MMPNLSIDIHKNPLSSLGAVELSKFSHIRPLEMDNLFLNSSDKNDVPSFTFSMMPNSK